MLNRTAETLKDYPFEAAYLNQMNNEARYLINGKGVVRRDNGSYLFFAVEDDETEFFHFGGTILDEHLSELTLMSKEEQELLKVLIDVDAGLNDYGLHVISGEFATDETGAQVIEDVVIYAPQGEAYVKMPLLELDYITTDTAAELNAFPPCPLSSPHLLAVAEDGAVMVKE